MSIEPKAIKVTEKVESVPLPVHVDGAIETLKPSKVLAFVAHLYKCDPNAKALKEYGQQDPL
jgi:hypothetical protein